MIEKLGESLITIPEETINQLEIKDDLRVKKLTDLSLKLEGLNRNVATHAAGVVIADKKLTDVVPCLLYTSPSPRDKRQSRMPSSA